MFEASEPSSSSNPNKTLEGNARLKDDELSKGSEPKECASCAALKKNTLQAFSSLCSLKQRLVVLENSDKDRQQLEKINRDQATLIDEFRNQLRKSESERNRVVFDYEQLKITNADLRRQLDDVLEASRKQKETIQRAKECEQRYAETLAALNAEHEAREELIRKYSKMADYAEAYEMQVKKLETELEKLRESCSTNEANIALYTQHCPSMLKLMLELADVVEKNASMNPSQRRRLVRYTSNFELRQALMRKGRLKKPNTVSISTNGDSEDDEMAESLENILSEENSKMEFDAQAKLHDDKEDKEVINAKQEGDTTILKQVQDRSSKKSIGKRRRNEKRSDAVENETKQPLRRSRRLMDAPLLEQAFADHLSRKLGHGEPSTDFSDVQHRSIHGKKSKPLWMIQSEMMEKKKKKKEESMRRKNGNRAKENPSEDDAIVSSGEEVSEAAKVPEVQRGESEAQDLNVGAVGGEDEVTDAGIECKCTYHLSSWRQFADVEPLLEMPSKPVALEERFRSSEIVPSVSSSSEGEIQVCPSQTLCESFGLSLSRSVSLESTTSSHAAVTSLRERLPSESLSIIEIPSGSSLDVGARSQVKQFMHTRTQSSSERPFINQEVKKRARSVSIAAVCGRDCDRMASWQIPEGSHMRLDRAFIKNDMVGERSQGIEKPVLGCVLFRNRKRLSLCEEASRIIEPESFQRRTMSCSIDSFDVPNSQLPIQRHTSSVKTEVSVSKRPSVSPKWELHSEQMLSPTKSKACKKNPPADDLKQREFCRAMGLLPPLLEPPKTLFGRENFICDVGPTVDSKSLNGVSSNVLPEERINMGVVSAEPTQPLKRVEMIEGDSATVKSTAVVEEYVIEASQENEETIAPGVIEGAEESQIKEAGEPRDPTAKVSEMAARQSPGERFNSKAILQEGEESDELVLITQSQMKKGKVIRKESDGGWLKDVSEDNKCVPEDRRQRTEEASKSKESIASDQRKVEPLERKQRLFSPTTTLSEEGILKNMTERSEQYSAPERHSLQLGLEISESSSESSDEERSLNGPEKGIVVTTEQIRSTRSYARKNLQTKEPIEKAKKQKKDLLVAVTSVKKQTLDKKRDSGSVEQKGQYRDNTGARKGESARTNTRGGQDRDNLETDKDESARTDRKGGQDRDSFGADKDESTRTGTKEGQDRDNLRTRMCGNMRTGTEGGQQRANFGVEKGKNGRTETRQEVVAPPVQIPATPEPSLVGRGTGVDVPLLSKNLQSDVYVGAVGEESDEEDTLRIVTEDDTNGSELNNKTGSNVLPVISDSESDEERGGLRIIDNDLSAENSKSAHPQPDVRATKKETPSIISHAPPKIHVSSSGRGNGEVFKKLRRILPKFMSKTKSQLQSVVRGKRMRVETDGVETRPSKLAKLTREGSARNKSTGSAILLPQPVTNKRLHSQNTSKSNAELAESAVMRLLDEAIASRSTLSILVKKCCQPPINEINSSRFVGCILKLLNTMEVGNMWSSMLAASRHGVVEQVASIKERNLFQLINQISAEPQWSDICEKLFMSLATSLQKTEAASVSQHGRDFRCMLIAGHIAAEEGQRAKVCSVLCDVLRHLVLRHSSEWVVPALCYTLAITPDLIKEFLIGKKDSLLATRTLIAVHLCARDDYYSLFSKMLALAYSVSEDEQQCLRRMDCDNFKEMFVIVEEIVISTESSVDLNTYNADNEFIRAMCECVAIFVAASIRLFPDKDIHIHQLISQALRTISEHPAVADSAVQESYASNIYADTTRRSCGVISDAEAWRASNALMLSCRLLLARVQLGSVDDEYVASFRCFRKQIRSLGTTFEKCASKSGVQCAGDWTIRLYSFAVHDWQRVLQPLIPNRTDQAPLPIRR